MPSHPALMQCPQGTVCELRDSCPGAQPHEWRAACKHPARHCPPCQPAAPQSVEHNGPASIIQAIDTAQQFGKTVNPAYIRAQAAATIEYHRRRDNGENPAWHDVKPVGIPQFLE